MKVRMVCGCAASFCAPPPDPGTWPGTEPPRPDTCRTGNLKRTEKGLRQRLGGTPNSAGPVIPLAILGIENVYIQKIY